MKRAFRTVKDSRIVRTFISVLAVTAILLSTTATASKLLSLGVKGLAEGVCVLCGVGAINGTEVRAARLIPYVSTRLQNSRVERRDGESLKTIVA